MSTRLQTSAVVTEAPQRCCEPGCDRDASVGDARCILHATRLGALPRDVVAPPVQVEAPVAPKPEPAAVTSARPIAGDWERLATGTMLSAIVAYGSLASVFLLHLSDAADVTLLGLSLAASIAGVVRGWKQFRAAEPGLQTALGLGLLLVASLPAAAIVPGLLVLFYNFVL